MYMKTKFIFLISFLIISSAEAGNWNNCGGNPSRNGLSDIPGPNAATVLWEGTSNGLFGNPIYIYGDKLVTMRFSSLTNAPVVCHNIYTGQLLWSAEITNGTGRSLPIGFRDGTVYVVVYTESNNDSLVALNALTGQRVWASKPGIAISITSSCVFASNGDLIVEGSGFKILRINHLTGANVWATSAVPRVVGHTEPVVYGNTVYIWEAVALGENITAYDINTGARKYTKVIPDTNPGGPLQQMAPMVGSDGIIYAYKSGDNVTALQDNGSALNILWTTPVRGNSPFSMMGEGPDTSIYVPSYGKILRLSKNTGKSYDSTASLGNPDLFIARVSVGSDGKVYITSESTFLCASSNLSTIFSETINGLNTSGCSIGPNNVLAVCGNGTTLKVYKTSVTSVFNQQISANNFSLKQNYPNPFNPNTTIKYELSKSNIVLLKIYDILGNELKTLVNGRQNAGSYSISFDGSGFTSGTYFYKLTAGDFTETKKMILNK